MMETTMASKPSKPKVARAKVVQTRDRSGEKPTAITIKGSLEWRDWVDRGASHCRTDVAKLVDSALVDYLRARGFTEEAPER
jgi:hypothetical protein